MQAGSNKKAVSKEALHELLGEGSDYIHGRIQGSIGLEPDESEFKALSALASAEMELRRQEQEIDKYLKESVPKLMPNIAFLSDYKMAAELLSKAGSLSKLANMPSGTLQLLGAEKALFRHLRSGAKPPKYGVLFKLKEVVEADRRSRGRIARLFATKLSIAARADAISKRFIGKQLRESLDASLKKIKEKESMPRPERSARYENRQGNQQERWKGKQQRWRGGKRR